MDACSTSHACMYVCNYVGTLMHLSVYVVMYRSMRAEQKVKKLGIQFSDKPKSVRVNVKRY